MDAMTTAHALKTWAVANSERIHSLPDSWLQHFREDYQRRLTEFEEGVREDGTTIGEQIDDALPETT